MIGRRSSQGGISLAILIGSMMGLTACTAAFARDTQPLAVLPSTDRLSTLVSEAHTRFKDVKEGANADYIPILATVPSELFAVVIVTRDGKMYSAGDADYRYSIQSVAKPFTAALVMQQYGNPNILKDKIGVEPTGLPFNSKLALEIFDARSVNPLVNAGAIASVSLVKAGNEEERWQKVHGNLQEFAGGAKLPLLDEVFKSE